MNCELVGPTQVYYRWLASFQGGFDSFGVNRVFLVGELSFQRVLLLS